jgi:hypothetical protein
VADRRYSRETDADHHNRAYRVLLV